MAVSNAGGVGGGGALAELTLASFDLTRNVTLRGAFLGMKYAIPVKRLLFNSPVSSDNRYQVRT